eukprot:Skav219385  [mRNA]  locus=scaffold2568:102735:103082:- [translate_table: standard]
MMLKLGDEIQVRVRQHRGESVEVGMRDLEEYQKRKPYEFSSGEEVEGTLLKVVKPNWKKTSERDRGATLVDVGGMIPACLPRKSLKDDPSGLVKGQKMKVRVVSTTGCTMDVEQV